MSEPRRVGAGIEDGRSTVTMASKSAMVSAFSNVAFLVNQWMS
jgi:hypothetical protein